MRPLERVHPVASQSALSRDRPRFEEPVAEPQITAYRYGHGRCNTIRRVRDHRRIDADGTVLDSNSVKYLQSGILSVGSRGAGNDTSPCGLKRSTGRSLRNHVVVTELQRPKQKQKHDGRRQSELDRGGACASHQLISSPAFLHGRLHDVRNRGGRLHCVRITGMVFAIALNAFCSSSPFVAK
jgi:hypothetical protein